MIDLAEFTVTRPLRRVEPTAEENLLLMSPLVRMVAQYLRQGATLADTAIADMLTTFKDDFGHTVERVENPDTARQYLSSLIYQIEIWLAQNEDLVSGEALEEKVKLAQIDYLDHYTTPDWEDALAAYAEDLASWTVAWLCETPKQHEKLAWAARYALVASLMQQALPALKPEQVYAKLNRRFVTLPTALAHAFPEARIKLIREASVADLHVVRSEWRGYLPGEIAMIRNVMAGETYQEKDKKLAETENITLSETTTSTSQQRQDENQNESEMSRDLQTQLSLAVRGQVQAEYEQNMPGSRYSVNAGAEASVQLGRSDRVASRIARKAVAKAVSTIESQTKESRQRRELVRTETTHNHAFASDDANRCGIYRWVDRVDRYQVFTYPDRLQLEFELPEPAEYVRWRTAAKVKASQAKAPPEWNVTKAALTPEGVLALASTYRATNLPVLPDAEVSVVLAKTAVAADLPDAAGNQWTPPTVEIAVEVAVPVGYAAHTVDYSGFATPLHGKWMRQSVAVNNYTSGPVDSYHGILANVYVGSSNAGYKKLIAEQSVQTTGQSEEPPRYGQATLNITTDTMAAVSIGITPPAIDKLTLSAQATGCHSLGMTFTVKCRRTTEAYETWQHAVYDALFSAWNDWNQTWQNAQDRRALVSELPVGESSPGRNLQTVRDELKRQVIAWLLDESPFIGRDGLKAVTPDSNGALPWRETDFAKARVDAATIQFFEQVFEWGNMAYVFYPYYWAGRGNWDELSTLEGVDPEFERFLKAGSCRVVVPARPGMEAAVHHWLLYQEPFLGRPMPLPGDSLFVSVAAEVRDMTQPPEGGIPGESWDSRSGTTLLWLDSSMTLPKNSVVKLGVAPNEPKEPITLP
ncbi:hypothetical protein SAMN05216350_11922 [Polaromonas sp. YR568]|uniref:hypothetical protein n=1 Tax=Polaromonas sp. YR568 TaxID=1855301 RepID=UPI0008EC34CC|nr:hypothetical protein [Polaromonas sp. YR568]SFV04196.1 hypothetical protein SAMN05216350_11922 [Polaromonas sp. YR568]